MGRAMNPDVLAEAIQGALVSVNEHDSNGEAANVVDALFAAARIVNYGLKAVAASNNTARMADALAELARQVGRVADALAGTMSQGLKS
jgi:hypothetical protein